MKRVELLTVTDTFWLAKNGVQMLMLLPDFSVPKGWKQQGWNARSEPVVVLKPDGDEVEATAQINMTHLNIPEPSAPIDSRWRIIVWLTDRKKEEVPIGSKILVSEEVRDTLLPSHIS